MNEFELATIAFQEATVAFQQASLALRGESLTVAKWQVGATLLIGLGQIAVVAWGIRAMQRATERRAEDARDEARRRDRADERRDKADERRHTEAMRALEALIARTGRPGDGA